MTFLLELSNFKSFEKHILKIPSSGLILIDGVSGSGKTSIIQAFLFAVTGQGKKIASYGSKKVKVTLTRLDENKTNKFSITRTKGPDALVLVANNKEYHDDEAQAIIEKEFGKHFTSSSVLLQKGTMSFLSLTPKERLTQIENILFTDFSIEDKKIKLKKNIKENEDKILEASAKCDTLISIKKSKIEKKPNDKLSHLKTIEECMIFKENITSKYNECITRLSSLKEDLSNYTVKLNDNNIKKERRSIVSKNLEEDEKNYLYNLEEYNKLGLIQNIEEIKIKIKTLESTLKYIHLCEELEKEESIIKKDKEALIKTVKDDIDKLQFSEEKLSEISSLIDKKEKELDKTTLVLSSKNRLDNINSKIQDRKKYISQINETELLHAIKSQEEKIIVLSKDKKEAEIAKTSIKCPCCSSMLRYISSSHSLEKFESTFYNVDVNKIDQEIQALRKSLDENKKKIENYKKISDSIELLEKDKELIEKEIPESSKESSLTELNDKVSELKKTIDELKSNKNKLIYNKNRISQLEDYKKDIEDNKHSILCSRQDKIKTIQTQITHIRKNITDEIDQESIQKEIVELKIIVENDLQIQKQKNRYHELYTQYLGKINTHKDSLEKLIVLSDKEEEEVINNINSLNEEIIVANFNIEELNLIENINNIDIQIQFLNYKEEMRNLEDDISKHNIERDNISVFTQKLKSLQTSIEIAESKLLYKFIDNLNQRVNYHLEAMFTDPLNVNISCFKETKKGEKPKIELELFYKGNETDISNLSGGEFDRLNMCFLLSFNELSRSNIIILDEALSSLNQELVCDIIEHLKENKEKDKLIIMTLHQSIKGMFDQVINL